MSNRTLVEINHDIVPNIHDADGSLRWFLGFAAYVRNGDKSKLPNGVTFKHMRHHSDPDPMAADPHDLSQPSRAALLAVADAAEALMRDTGDLSARTRLRDALRAIGRAV